MKGIRAIVLACVALLGLAGCRDLRGINSVESAPPKMERAQPAAFEYHAATLDGTPGLQARAFAIDRRRLLTARHAVLGFARHLVKVGGEWQEADLLGASEYCDAALLQLPSDLPASYAPIVLDAAPVQAGDQVAVAGHAGRIEGLNTAQLDGQLHRGDSGSPVERAGKAVGILRGYATNDATLGHFTDAAQVGAWLATLRK